MLVVSKHTARIIYNIFEIIVFFLFWHAYFDDSINSMLVNILCFMCVLYSKAMLEFHDFIDSYK